jgi:hypothetical protein
LNILILSAVFLLFTFHLTGYVAYDMYLECCEGKLVQEWKVQSVETFHTFREILLSQMMRCNPANLQYPGDQLMRVNTSKPRVQCAGERRGDYMTGRWIGRSR